MDSWGHLDGFAAGERLVFIQIETGKNDFARLARIQNTATLEESFEKLDVTV